MDLKEFLLIAKKSTYANENAEEIILGDRAKELIYSEGCLLYRDRYFGGNPFSGEEVVFSDGKAIWIMNYYGKCLKSLFVKNVYDFLKKSLNAVSIDLPLRGPELFELNGFGYINKVEGDFYFFKGEEQIFLKDKLIYVCNYHGENCNVS